jgi:hypothetical protein
VVAVPVLGAASPWQPSDVRQQLFAEGVPLWDTRILRTVTLDAESRRGARLPRLPVAHAPGAWGGRPRASARRGIFLSH